MKFKLVNTTSRYNFYCIDVCNGSSSLLAGPEEIGLTRDYVVDINGEGLYCTLQIPSGDVKFAYENFSQRAKIFE